MIYKATITSGAELNITRTILQLDEFLKEYWGTEVYQIKTSSGILRNTDVFELGMRLSKEYVSFYCFQ